MRQAVFIASVDYKWNCKDYDQGQDSKKENVSAEAELLDLFPYNNRWYEDAEAKYIDILLLKYVGRGKKFWAQRDCDLREKDHVESKDTENCHYYQNIEYDIAYRAETFVSNDAKVCGTF